MPNRPDVALAAVAAVASVMLAEQEDGSAPRDAARPLTPEERAARVKFSELEAAIDAAQAAGINIVDALAAALGQTIAAVLLDGKDTATPAEVMARLEGLSAARPAGATDLIREAAAGLSTVVESARAEAAALAVAEAVRQGVNPPKGATAPKATPDRWAAPSALAASSVWDRLTTVARARLVTPERLASAVPFTRGDLLRGVVELDPDKDLRGPRDMARQIVLQGHGTGRTEAAASLPVVDCWASEIMDGETCGNCARNDGHKYDTLEEARAAYPYGGYYACEGGLRCRGTLVFMYDPKDTAPPPPPAWEPGYPAELDTLIPHKP